MTNSTEGSSRWQPAHWAPWQRALATLAAAFVLAVSWEMSGQSQIQVYFNQIFVAFDSGPNCVPKTQKSEDGGTLQGEVDSGNSVGYPGAPGISGGVTPALIQYEFPKGAGGGPGETTYPSDCLELCTQIGYDNEIGSNIPIDAMTVEVFKFAPGANPLDPGSTPPLRTFTFSAIGQMTGDNTTTNDYNNFPLGIKPIPTPGTLPGLNAGGSTAGICIGWDGSYNVEGEFGRTNGQFGFRVTARTDRQTQQNANIKIVTDPPGVYPSVEAGHLQSPITIDVVDIHVVRSTPTVLGSRPAVAVEPYNLKYRISKDALVTIQVVCPHATTCGQVPAGQVVRTVVGTVSGGNLMGSPRVGEGVPGGTLTNGDSWDGRDSNGNLMPPGNYIVALSAVATTSGTDEDVGLNSVGAVIDSKLVRQVSLDPLQITDINISPLLDASTALAFLTYTLSEDATTYVDIYPPDTYFPGQSGYTDGIQNNFNSNPPSSNCPYGLDGGASPPPGADRLPSSCLQPTNSITKIPVQPVRTLSQHQISRTPVFMVWDGRDGNGSVLQDGNYVFVLYAAAPSAEGAHPPGWATPSVFTSKVSQGILSVSRGFPGISQIIPRTSVFGSTPSVAGLDPVTFSYSLTRDSIVNVAIFHATDTVTTPPFCSTCAAHPEKVLVNSETRSAGFLNNERWLDGYSDNGYLVAPGDYLVQLTAQDPFFANKVSTVAASFPVDLLRITDVVDTALLSGATDRIFLNYQLSRPMQITWAVFPPGSSIQWSPSGVPPCEATALPLTNCQHVIGPLGTTASPVFTETFFRPGRPLKVTESWDGRDPNGILLKDGLYPFTLVAVTTEPVEGAGAGCPQCSYASDRIFGTVTIARGPSTFQSFGVIPTVAQVVNSSDVVLLPPFEIDFSFTRTSSASITILDNSIPAHTIRTVDPGTVVFPNLLTKEFWDGRNDQGGFVPQGFYTVQVIGTDVSAQLLQPATFQQTIAVNPLVIYDLAVSPVTLTSPQAQIAYQISEAMKVSIQIFKPGTSFDSTGNPTPPENLSLVRALVGVKPARTPIKDLWDGRDFQLSVVPDGDYQFKIFGSTDINAINSITGDAAPGTLLAGVGGAGLGSGAEVSDIPVTRNGTTDPESDFTSNTFFYPNPLPPGQFGNIKIRVPIRATVDFKMYTLAGDLVFDQSYPEQQPDTYLNYTWQRANAAGRAVAPGLYFIVFREEGTGGDREVLQMVKKVLVQ